MLHLYKTCLRITLPISTMTGTIVSLVNENQTGFKNNFRAITGGTAIGFATGLFFPVTYPLAAIYLTLV